MTTKPRFRLPIGVLVPTIVFWTCIIGGRIAHGLSDPPRINGRLHNGNVSDCLSCHACPTPTPADRCLKPCTRGPEHRPESEATKKVPDVVILGELQEHYLPVPFDHAGHAEMSRMAGGCVSCHHYTPQGSEHPACKHCHEPSNNRVDIRKPGLKGAYHRQCMGCHREWGGETDCSICHRPRTGAVRPEAPLPLPTPDDLIGRMHPPIPEPAVEVYRIEKEGFPKGQVMFRHREHVHEYDLRCSDCHREDNCNRCHEAGKEHFQKVRTLDEHHRPCFECHRDDACERCHYAEGQSPPPVFEHARTGWSLGRYHQGKSCRACHATVPYKSLSKDCNACHASWAPENFDHARTGQRLDDNHARLDCALCHVDRKFNTPPTCTECHEAEEGITFPAKRPGPWVAPGAAP